MLLGAITGAHGLKGEVVLKLFTEDPEGIMAYGALQSEDGSANFEVTGLRPQKGGFVARLKGVGSRNEAETLKGVGLYVPRSALGEAAEEDEFFQADLIGLEVRDGDEAIGLIKRCRIWCWGSFGNPAQGAKGNGAFALYPGRCARSGCKRRICAGFPPDGLWDKPGQRPPEEGEGEG